MALHMLTYHSSCQAAPPVFFSFDFASKPYAIAAAVGSLTIRNTFLGSIA